MPDSSVTVDSVDYDTWLDVDNQQRQVVHLRAPQSAVRTTVSATTTSIQLLATNPARQKLLIWNNGTTTLYLGLGAAAVTNTDASLLLGPGDLWEYDWAGAVQGVWGTGATGSALVTEVSP